MKFLKTIAMFAFLFSLASCGEDTKTDNALLDGSVPPLVAQPEAPVVIQPEGPAQPRAVTLSLSYGVKRLNFSWNAVDGATVYRLYENPDGVSGFVQIGGDLTTTSYTKEITVYRHNWQSALYRVDACNAEGCIESPQIDTAGGSPHAIGIFTASNPSTDPDSPDYFGRTTAISADGSTLAVGAWGEASNAAGINGNQGDNSMPNAGAVYVYTKSGAGWNQQAYIKPLDPQIHGGFGAAVAISHDGNTLAVGTFDPNGGGSEAAYIFTRSGATWTQQARLTASNSGPDYFGSALTLSGDGDTLAVGAFREASNATGINGNQADNSALYAGAVYVYTRAGMTWTQQAYIKASNAEGKASIEGDDGDFFGFSVSLADDGNTLAVGAWGEDSNATGINGNQADNSAQGAGATYVFTRSGSTWTQQAYIKASNAEGSAGTFWQAYKEGDNFGSSVALNADGNTLAVGAWGESSNATGLDGNQMDNSAPRSGAVYVFTRSDITWTQQAYVKASNAEGGWAPGFGDYFGSSVALTDDGGTLAVGAYEESSNAIGINGNQANNSASESGAVYIFDRAGSTWAQQSYVKAPVSAAGSYFGFSTMALTGDGSTLAIPGSGHEAAYLY